MPPSKDACVRCEAHLAEIVRLQGLWGLQSRIIKALAAAVPDDVRVRVLAPLVKADRG